MTPAPDQTRGEAIPCIAEGLSTPLSQNEVQSLCLKAARGAGMSWGLAEEAGFAVAWLVQHGIDGARHLRAHLEEAQGRAWQDLCPIVGSDVWQAPPSGLLCPIALGCTLCDFAGLSDGIRAGGVLEIGVVNHPVLAIPFLAEIGASRNLLFDIAWEGETVHPDGGGEALFHAASALGDKRVALTLIVRSGSPMTATAGPVPSISAGDVAALGALAMRTCVPASESSRAGAGAGISDND